MHSQDLVGSFEAKQFPSVHHPTIDTLIWGSKRHHIPILLEIDVTEAREAIAHSQQETGQSISFTRWIVKCLAQAVSEHGSVHALRWGKRRVVVFEDVDVTVIVERSLGQSRETLPMPYIVRKANEKSVAEIHSEIRTAQRARVAEGEVQIGSSRTAWMTKLFTLLPRFLRDWLFWQPLWRNPFRFKRLMGTVSVTSLAISGQNGMSWGIPIGIHPLIVAVGAIAKKPGIVGELVAAELRYRILIREYVGLTVLFDHDVTDGAPVARFIKRLQELMRGGYGLEKVRQGNIKTVENIPKI